MTFDNLVRLVSGAGECAGTWGPGDGGECARAGHLLNAHPASVTRHGPSCWRIIEVPSCATCAKAWVIWSGGTPPSHCRRYEHETALSQGAVTLQLAYRPLFNWPLLVGLLTDEATPGVESVCDRAYCRTIAIGQRAGWFKVCPLLDRNLLCLSLQLPDYTRLKNVMERVRTMFDLDANPDQIAHQLAEHPHCASLVRHAAGLRLLGAWDGFEVAVRVLVARDVGRDRTAPVMRKLAATYGQPFLSSGAPHVTTLFPSATALMQASIASLGLSGTAVHSIHTLAKAVVDGRMRFDPFLTFDELVSGLMRLVNLDQPSAHWIAMRTLGEPDANPFGAPSLPTALVPPWLTATTQATLRPWRSYAAMLLATTCSTLPVDAGSS
jgi:AraC family transcriptional regulator, regulatory protein of adaptative response / DNA-3-methyladenine glycosylase II